MRRSNHLIRLEIAHLHCTAWAFSPILTDGTVLAHSVSVSGNARFAKQIEVSKSGAHTCTVQLTCLAGGAGVSRTAHTCPEPQVPGSVVVVPPLLATT